MYISNQCSWPFIKIEKLCFIIDDSNINLFFVQESKLTQPGKLKFSGSDDFDIYELNTTDKSGGGIVIVL